MCDLSVYLPKEKVLFMSESYLHRIFPAMRSAYPSEWVQAVKNAEAIAYRYDLDRQVIQRFVGEVDWDHEPLIDELNAQVAAPSPNSRPNTVCQRFWPR